MEWRIYIRMCDWNKKYIQKLRKESISDTPTPQIPKLSTKIKRQRVKFLITEKKYIKTHLLQPKKPSQSHCGK